MPPPPEADRRLPSLDALLALDAVAQLGSFERAAEALNLSASAVSKRVAALESQLGCALLSRNARAPGPTPAGQDYLAQVRPALALLAAVPLHQRSAQRRLRLRLTAPPTFARLVLVPALPAFERAHPGLELEILLSTPMFGSSGPDAELRVMHGVVDHAGDALMDDVLLPLASPALLPGGATDAAGLARLPRLCTPVHRWEPWCRAAGLELPEPTQGTRLVDLGLLLDAAVDGQGVTLMRPSLARQALRSGRLVPVFGVGRTPWVPAGQHYHLGPEAADSPGLQALADWIRGVGHEAAAEGLALVSGPA